MTDRDFLLTIIENPKEDGPRLVFADWLEETGRCEMAEYIRLSIEMEKTPQFEHFECKVCSATPDEEGEIRHGKGCYVLSSDGGGEEYAEENPRYVEISDRRDELLRKNQKEWMGEFLSSLRDVDALIPGPSILLLIWKRGFLSEVSLTESDFLKCAPQLCWHPIEKVTLTDRKTINTGGEVRREFRWWNKKWFDSLRIVSDIEEDIWNRIENYAVGFSTVKIFHSQEAAVSALEQGCLSYLNSLRIPESCIPSDVTIQQLRPEEQPLDA